MSVFQAQNPYTDKAFIVAEIGNNHDGNVDKAINLIDVAYECGADAVKFQTFSGLDIVSPIVKPSEYPQWKVTNFDYWYQFLDSIALPLEAHKEVFDYARNKGLMVFSTPTSPDLVSFLESIDIQAYKVASMDLTNTPLLRRVAETKKPVIVSTGMASDSEISSLLQLFPDSPVTLLHCISDYPLNPQHANLLSIKHLQKSYPTVTSVGFSDHSLDSHLSCLAIVLGAKVIEKHITYDRNSSTPAEHHFSMDPVMFKNFVKDIRQTEAALGTCSLTRSPDELINRAKYRRSIHVNKDLQKDSILSSDDLHVVRPGDGISPDNMLNIIGARLTVSKKAWDPLQFSDFVHL